MFAAHNIHDRGSPYALKILKASCGTVRGLRVLQRRHGIFARLLSCILHGLLDLWIIHPWPHRPCCLLCSSDLCSIREKLGKYIIVQGSLPFTLTSIHATPPHSLEKRVELGQVASFSSRHREFLTSCNSTRVEQWACPKTTHIGRQHSRTASSRLWKCAWKKPMQNVRNTQLHRQTPIATA